MELVLGHQELISPGGSETYLLTVAEQLQRLGHQVTVFTLDRGAMADLMAGRGVRVVSAEHALPKECDGVLVQDAVVSLILAERYPSVPQVFVAHAPGQDVQRPVQVEDVISLVVVLNDLVAERLDALAHRHELVRLRQPVDLKRFQPHHGPREEPERVLLLSSYLRGPARDALATACAGAGMRFEQVGLPTRLSTTPEVEIATSDITVANGRGVVEAMASGRAVYVLGHWGGDGWVTPASYPDLEARGFTGLATDDTVDLDALTRDLRRYRREMGQLNRQLACANHHATDHAGELVALFRRLAPGARRAPAGPLREMARLVRLQWQADARAGALAEENRRLRDELDEERRRTEEHLAALKSTRRYRIGTLLARPLDALRRHR